MCNTSFWRISESFVTNVRLSSISLSSSDLLLAIAMANLVLNGCILSLDLVFNSSKFLQAGSTKVLESLDTNLFMFDCRSILIEMSPSPFQGEVFNFHAKDFLQIRWLKFYSKNFRMLHDSFVNLKEHKLFFYYSLFTSF